MSRADRFQKRDSIKRRKHQVENQAIKRLAQRAIQAGSSVTFHDDFISLVLQPTLKGPPNFILILNDQNTSHPLDTRTVPHLASPKFTPHVRLPKRTREFLSG